MLFDMSDDFGSAYMCRIITLIIALKPPLQMKFKMHNRDIQKKCYRPHDTKMGNTYILKAENMD